MTWQEELGKNLCSVRELAALINLTDAQIKQTAEILERFPLSVTRYYLSLINFSDPCDPIRKMALPSIDETDLNGSFDTSGEAANTITEGLQHKYPQTALLLSSSSCAMYCRHCFRKRFVGISNEETANGLKKLHHYILEHKEISNVLISGGDALLNENNRLEKLLLPLAQIKHLDIVRIASRTPVVFPERITTDPKLARLLKYFCSKKQLYFITQFNHPSEITSQALKAVAVIKKAGVCIKNQTVLLKGVNDNAQTLGLLLKKLTACGVEPYYIFQCRPVAAVKKQFQVPLKKACDIVEEAKKMQNGLGKNFKFCMSHITGKIEILGMLSKTKMLFKYHECADASKLGIPFAKKIKVSQTWFD